MNKVSSNRNWCGPR